MISPSGTYPNFIDTTVSLGNCYQYQYLVSDNIQNQTTYTSAHTAMIEDVANLQIESISSTVTSGTNNTHVANNIFTNTGTTAQLGTSSNNSTNHFMLFDNVNIAKGANLTSAILKLTSTNSGAGTTNVRIAAHNIANGTTPADLADFIDKQNALTVQTVDWNAVPVGAYGEVLSSPDITSVIQALINRSDWSTGNSILLWIGNNGSTNWSTTTFVTSGSTGAEQKPTLDLSYIYINYNPEPHDDSYLTNSEITLSVLSNDIDPDGDPMTIVSVSDPDHGTATISGQVILYTPDSNYTGTDTFTYTVSDNHSHTGTATVTIDVMENPIYYTLSFTVDKSDVPALYYPLLSYVAHLGSVATATVTSGGTPVTSSYDSDTGNLWFTSNQNSFQILVKNPADPTVFSVGKAPLLNNKNFAWSHGMDDNVNLAAQVALLTAKGWRGTFNLIGNIIQDTRNESWIYDKPILTLLLEAGWSLSNHTYDHQCFGANMTDPTWMENTILNGYNKIMEIVTNSTVPTYKVLDFAAPCFASAYDQYIISMRAAGTTAVMFNESQASGLMIVDQNATSYNRSGLTASPVDSNTVKIGRDMSVETDYNVTINTIDWMATSSSSVRHFWLNTLSHGSKEASLSQIINHTYDNYGPGGTDEIWVAPATEIYSYMLVRDNTVLSSLTSTKVADGLGPVISSLVSTPSSSIANISWGTNRNASSQLKYGLSSTDLHLTTEADTVSRVSSHQYNLSNLFSCTKYYYQSLSTDDYEGKSTSALQSFYTGGCPNDSTILSETDEIVDPSIGGTLSLSGTNGLLDLLVPKNFATQSAVFQAIEINKTEAFETIGTPTGIFSVGNLLVQLSAIGDLSQKISDFSAPITITFHYVTADIEGLDEDSLVIQRWDGSSWNSLQDCVVDSSAKTVTCQTTGFSLFGLFGSQTVVEPDTTTNTNTTTNSFSTSYTSAFPMDCSDASPSAASDLFQIDATGTTANLFFTPIANTNTYYISYSTKPIAEEHGAKVTLAKEGVQKFKVKSLKPNTSYYFKVRGQNGCMPGGWSNIIKITTKSKYSLLTAHFYRYKPKSNNTKSNITPIATVTPSVTVSEPTPTTVVLGTTTPKRCFLWWCR